MPYKAVLSSAKLIKVTSASCYYTFWSSSQKITITLASIPETNFFLDHWQKRFCQWVFPVFHVSHAGYYLSKGLYFFLAVLQEHGRKEITIVNPAQFPDKSVVSEYLEPMVVGTILAPDSYTGKIMALCQVRTVLNLPVKALWSLHNRSPNNMFFFKLKLTKRLLVGGSESGVILLCCCQNRRAFQKNMVYIDDQRVMMKYLFPLNEIVVDFYDLLKSMSSGYARWCSMRNIPANTKSTINIVCILISNHW